MKQQNLPFVDDWRPQSIRLPSMEELEAIDQREQARLDAGDALPPRRRPATTTEKRAARGR